MHKYVINGNYSSTRREVDADEFVTVGDYIDFFATNRSNHTMVVLRIKASEVITVELADALN